MATLPQVRTEKLRELFQPVLIDICFQSLRILTLTVPSEPYTLTLHAQGLRKAKSGLPLSPGADPGHRRGGRGGAF